MKGSMKKLAVFVIVAAIVMFTVATMASADDHRGKNTIRGQYAATQWGSCILSIFGFNSDFTPACYTPPGGSPLCIASIQMFNRAGDYTFEKNGTGTVTLNGSSITLSYIGPSGQVPSNASSQTMSWDFTYTVTGDGMITTTGVPGTCITTHNSGPLSGKTYEVEGVSATGAITPDGKNITLHAGPPNLLTLYGPNIPNVGQPNFSCQSSTVLIRQDN